MVPSLGITDKTEKIHMPFYNVGYVLGNRKTLIQYTYDLLDSRLDIKWNRLG